MENSTNNNVNGGLQFFNAAGVRAPKAINEDVLIAESTRASFKLMPAVCAKLGIGDGNYVTMQLTKDEFGVVNGVYVGKGKDAVLAKDPDGNFILDDRKRKTIEVDGYGALATEATAGTNVLKISMASAWDAIGDTELKKHYKLSDEGIEAQLPIGDGEILTTTLYKLEFVKDEPKVERASKKSDDDVKTEDAALSPEATQEAPAAPAPEAPVTATPAQAFEAPVGEDDEF